MRRVNLPPSHPPAPPPSSQPTRKPAPSRTAGAGAQSACAGRGEGGGRRLLLGERAAPGTGTGGRSAAPSPAPLRSSPSRSVLLSFPPSLPRAVPVARPRHEAEQPRPRMLRGRQPGARAAAEEPLRAPAAPRPPAESQGRGTAALPPSPRAPFPPSPLPPSHRPPSISSPPRSVRRRGRGRLRASPQPLGLIYSYIYLISVAGLVRRKFGLQPAGGGRQGSGGRGVGDPRPCLASKGAEAGAQPRPKLAVGFGALAG